MKVRYNIQPTGPIAQQFFHERGATIEMIRGPVGSGKTTTAMIKLLTLAQLQEPNDEGVRPTAWFIIRRSYEDLRKTIYKDWCQQWDAIRAFRRTTVQPMEDLVTYGLPDGTSIEAKIVFLALDKEEDVERFRGGNYTGGLGNEVKQLHRVHLNTAVARSGRYPSQALGGVELTPGIATVICDTNAPSSDHWMEPLEKDPPPGWRFYVQPPAVFREKDPRAAGLPLLRSIQGKLWAINPNAENIQNVKPKYYERLIQTLNDDEIAADLCNEYTNVQEGRAVYTEYVDATHCSDACLPDPALPLVLGADGGLTPTVIITQQSPRGQLRVLDELVAEDMGVRQFWRDVVKPHLEKEYPGFEIDTAQFDPSGDNRGEGIGLSAIGILTDRYIGDPDVEFDLEPMALEFDVEQAITNDITLRLDSVKGFLTRMIDGAPGFLMHPKCKQLRKGFNGKYHYKRVKVSGPERYQEKPDKNEYSHPHDALQYAALRAAGGSIQSNRGIQHDREEPRGRDSATGY